MLHVSNGKYIRHLGFKSLLAARTRNVVAVLAIILTTLLFTSLFTIALSINEGMQQNTFRQVGGDAHGTFKDVTLAQLEELRSDPLIVDSGARLFLGMPTDAPFHKTHVEVSYMDECCAEHFFCTPEYGTLPHEGTDEAAADTRVLSLLDVEPELGAEFTVSFYIDPNTASPTLITRTFTLSGWWTYDEACMASDVLLPRSAAEEIAALSNGDELSMTGKWSLHVMFKSSLHIEEDMLQVLEKHGYQNEGRAVGDNFIPTGVNWGYTGTSLSGGDSTTTIMILALLLLIIFTGYLIIYNVFQISVTNDIRFYGLLKTIGTTGRQLKRMIRQQALILSGIGIPIGLLLGWLVGVTLTPVVAVQLDGVSLAFSANPTIFLGATVFSLGTVFLSCARPGRLASGVSPVEAVRYTEGRQSGRTFKKGEKEVSLPGMAWANLGRSRGKTVVTVLSLSLAVLLLTLTVTFVHGFSMDKYISNFVATDFIVGDAAYFQAGQSLWAAENALPEELIETIQAQGGLQDGGRTYGKTSPVLEFIDEDYYRQACGRWNDTETLDQMVSLMDRAGNGKLLNGVQLYGMERFCLDQLTVLEGSLSGLYEPGSRYIAAVCSADDSGKPKEGSHWAKLGDTVTLRYVETYEYYDPVTGEVYPEDMDLSTVAWIARAVEYTDVEYEVAALVDIPYPLTYRYSLLGTSEFVFNDQTFRQDTGTSNVMYYACNMVDDAANDHMETFLADYTENVDAQWDYESKATYVAEFDGFLGMFLLLGGVLSFIVGLVGVMNFANTILTGILARKREFAVLQAVGMTGKQLKTMLVYEGLYDTLLALGLSLLLTVAVGPLLGNTLNNVFWFFDYRLTLAPLLAMLPLFLLLGVLLPLAAYRTIARATIVERLRETDG